MIAKLLSALPFEWAQYQFMHMALLGMVILAPLFAVLGCLVISNQMAFFADAIGHSALTGIALGVLAGLQEPLWAMLIFAVILAAAIAWLRHKQLAPADAVIGLVMSCTVALGIVLLSRQGGLHRYARYLVGDILTIAPADLLRVGALALAVVLILAWQYNRIVLVTLHRPLAASRGVCVWRTELLFTVLIAVSVTLSIEWMGLLVINSLLILPAAAARNLARSAAGYVLWAVAVSLTSGIGGVIASYYLSTATGATIVLCAMGVFAVSVMFRR